LALLDLLSESPARQHDTQQRGAPHLRFLLTAFLISGE